ncbi:MAG: hypothetical protein K0R31_597 [Clostridiales bacterium]|jgi:hypothetical protein|nr:hypothetical protein [Clostridiales bacterium]
MGIKNFLKAVFSVKNFLLLAAVLTVTYITGYLPFTFVGLAGYLYFVLQTLKEHDSKSEYSDSEEDENIQKLSSDCDDLYREVRKTVSKQELIKIKAILQDKDELMKLFYEFKEDYLKRKIIEQALNLVIAYIRLTAALSVRVKDLATVDVNLVRERIINNERKLLILKDQEAISDLKGAIEMDKELVDRINNERIQFQRTSSKLDYIESAIRSFKHQVVSSESSDEAVNDIQNIINEATALDNVLDQSKEERLRF